MKKIIFLLTLIITTAVWAGTENQWRLSPDAYGPIHIGMKTSQAANASGKILMHKAEGQIPQHELAAGSCEYVKFADGPDGIRLMLKNGVITRIEITNPMVISDRGIHVGDTEQKLKAAYKNQLTHVEGNFLMYLPKANKYGQMFEIDASSSPAKVISMVSGGVQAIKSGC